MTESELLRSGAGLVAIVLVALAAYGIVETAMPALPAPGEGVPPFGTVFLIVGENTEASDVNAGSSPFLVSTVLPQAAWLTSYYAITHHSLANYIAMTSGQYTPCQQGDGSPAECHQSTGNLFSQLDAASISWQVWEESMPTPCDLVDSGNRSSLNPYGTDHNPAIYYDEIEGKGGRWSGTNVSSECLSRVVPTGSTGPENMSVLNTALAGGTVARFNMIVPNECEDGHSPCPPSWNRLRQFDAFLSREVPLILGSPSFGPSGVLVITYDEGTTGHFNLADRFGRGGHVVLAIVSPLASRGSSGGAFDHYGLLRMLEDGFRLASYLGNAAKAAPILGIWTG